MGCSRRELELLSWAELIDRLAADRERRAMDWDGLSSAVAAGFGAEIPNPYRSERFSAARAPQRTTKSEYEDLKGRLSSDHRLN